MKLKFSVLAAAALLASTLTPALAANTQCAVGLNTVPYRAGYILLIRDYASPATKTDLQVDGAVCSDLIASGLWTGVSSNHEWDARNGGDFYPVCSVTWSGNTYGTSLDVWATLKGRSYGMADCGDYDAQPDSTVKYFPAGTFTTD